MIRDLRVGSQTFGVSNGNATIRMYVDESSDLTSTWSNTQHVLELDIPADADTKFYRFRMDYGVHLGVPIGTHSSSDIVFRPSPNSKKFGSVYSINVVKQNI